MIVMARRAAALCGLAIAAASAGSPVPTPSATSAEARPEDVAARTPAGHNFIVPRGWTLTRRAGATILEAPETGSWVALVEVDADDAASAVAEAWKAYRGGVAPDLMMSVPAANKTGWRVVRNHVYRAAPARQLTARAMRHGARWAVRIDDLANAVSGKRSADLALIRDEFLPAGYARESFSGRKARKLGTSDIAALRNFIDDSRKRLDVPGIAVGIVQDGEIVLAEGFGVRERGKPAKVDADTLYLIASSTKPLTTLLLAKLVDEGKLDWETPVAARLPQFRLGEPAMTRRVLVKHLLCACTGLPYRNLDWEFAPAGARADITFDILARMRPTTPFGTTYQYSNPIAAAGGYVGGHVAYPAMELGAAYDAAMASRVFRPLGMRRTTFDFARARRGNHARAYGVTPLGALAPVDAARERQMHAIRPAGGAWSNVNDLLAWVRMELDGGRLDNGQRYISEAALKARWAPQVPTGRHSAYGMGLETSRSTGTPVMFHGGRFYGHRGDTIWLPDHGVGAVILMNASTGNVLMEALPRKLLELLFDGEPEADSMVAAAVAAEREQRAVLRRSLRFPADARHAGALAPRYRNRFLGELRVAKSGAQTVFDFGAWRAPVASRESAGGAVDFVVVTPSAPPAFAVGRSGPRRTLTIRDAQNDYVFAETD